MSTTATPPRTRYVCPLCERTFDRPHASCPHCDSTLVVPLENRSVYASILPMCGK
ncbi:hypothetical protein ACFQGE_07090 [Halomicroarcula sp. GCM10025817]|uniref:hypothetical protein n=1 Tax=Haloarcula TaxID=2237 RepID=UPI0023E7D342|nr:hypothetical protein [Halomicroarcula sp. SYNS111]